MQIQAASLVTGRARTKKVALAALAMLLGAGPAPAQDRGEGGGATADQPWLRSTASAQQVLQLRHAGLQDPWRSSPNLKIISGRQLV